MESFLLKNIDEVYKYIPMKQSEDGLRRLTVEDTFRALELDAFEGKILSKDSEGNFIFLNYRKLNNDVLDWVKNKINGDSKISHQIHIEIEKQLISVIKSKTLYFMNKINRICMGNFDFIYPFKILDDLKRSHIVLTSKNTDRIRQQQGAFIYPAYPTKFDLKSSFSEEEKIKSAQDRVHKSINELSICQDKSKYVIPGKIKPEIRKHLASIGFTKGYIYADISRQSETLISS